MDLSRKSTKDIGNLGELIAGEYLRRHGFSILEKNIVRKMGELDIVVQKGDTLHFIEVKSVLRREFPDMGSTGDHYNPSNNLHPQKLRKVARMAMWYVAEKKWEGEWQVDGVLVWLRERDGIARVEYVPQII